jgi:integrase
MPAFLSSHIRLRPPTSFPYNFRTQEKGACMARTVRNAKLDSRSARSKLPIRREPNWVVISKGCALGYRKGHRGGTWIARYRDDAGKQHYTALGAADDALDTDGGGLCLTYADAQRKADKWFKLAARGFEEGFASTGSYTVKNAMSDYMTAYKRRGGKAAGRTQAAIDALILPVLGALHVAKLSRHRIEEWHEGLAKAAPRLRTRPGRKQNFRKLEATPEGHRRRRSSANRVLTILKAALNHAHHMHKVSDDDAWRSAKPFREADGVRVRYLNDDEARRLVNAASPDFRPLVQAALLTGCRYGELIALVAEDYNADSGTVHVRVSKSGKPRHVVLTDEGRKFFDGRAAGKRPEDLLFSKGDGSPWSTSHQQRPFNAASKVAKLDPLTFHELRHTYAARLIMRGAQLGVVAAQLGHSDTRMVEKHYGHMAPSYVADAVRAAFGTLGVTEDSSVALLRRPA